MVGLYRAIGSNELKFIRENKKFPDKLPNINSPEFICFETDIDVARSTAKEIHGFVVSIILGSTYMSDLDRTSTNGVCIRPYFLPSFNERITGNISVIEKYDGSIKHI